MSNRGCTLVAFLLGLPLVAGCGPSLVNVSGKVTYNGKPVTSGHVTLIGSDDIPRTGEIDQDGTYKIEGIPTGTAKVGVSSPDPYRFETVAGRARQSVLGGEGGVSGSSLPKPPKGSWFPLPEQYHDATKSGLTLEVTGETLNIEIPAG